MTPDSAALDAAIRQARYLLFAFDGPVRSADKTKSISAAVITALASAYLHDALAACRESGRSAAVISANPPTEVHDYLNPMTCRLRSPRWPYRSASQPARSKPLRPSAYSSPVPRPTSKPPKPRERRPSATPERPTTPPTWPTPEQPRSSTAWPPQRSHYAHFHYASGLSAAVPSLFRQTSISNGKQREPTSEIQVGRHSHR